jgi:hypothetical protein
MASPTDTFVKPAIELIEDASLALKWSNSALVVRLFSQIATFFMFMITNG